MAGLPELDTALLQLAGMAVGEALGGFVLVGVATEPAMALRFAGHGTELVVELAPLQDGMPHAAASGRLAISYRAGPDVVPGVGATLCRAVAERVRAREDPVLDRLSREAGTAPRVRLVEVARLLEPGTGGRHHGLSPYVGCTIGCRFCYARQRLHAVRRLVGLPEVAWGSWVDVRINAPEILARELAELPRRPIKFCPVVSDPYHAVEARHRITRRCLETIAAADDPPPTLVLTRSAAILEDLDRLAALPRAWVGVSIPTIDDDVRAHFEPRAATVAQRLHVLQRARQAGLATIAVVQPQLPGPAEALAEALAEHADSVRIDVLRGEGDATVDFDDPRHASARTDAWQRERATALGQALQRRGIPCWDGELPPELSG